jgi:hypothetical protein
LWNKSLPYSFVGNDFQSWKVYAVSVTGIGSRCSSCHRMGLSSIGGIYPQEFSPRGSRGTAQVFGPEATALTQVHKNDHSAASPIWMIPGQNTTYDQSVENHAKAVAACAQAIAKHGNDSTAPPPPSKCTWVQYGQGNTCRGAPIRGVLNGATQSTPGSDRVETTVDTGVCARGECPVGFCYWRTLHGPFWQTSASSVPIDAPNYRGGFIRIYVNERGIWQPAALFDPTGGPPNAPPGGTFECTRYNEIVTVPDSNRCFAQPFSIVDPDGTRLSDAVDATVRGLTANVLSGLIGNVAQADVTHEHLDFLRVFEKGEKVLLAQSHSSKPPLPLKVGPDTGESWTNGCEAWKPAYASKDVFSESDVLLVPPSQSHNVRCFITGITGAWSSTRNNATLQPYAEIYTGPMKDIRLRVFPTSLGSPPDSVGAYASCIRLN